MKFFKKQSIKNNLVSNYLYNTSIVDNHGFNYFYKDLDEYFISLDLGLLKKNVKNRKISSKIKKGITTTEKKNSLKRDKNLPMLNQFINIMNGDGNKRLIFKNFNKAIELFFFTLNEENEEFFKYKNYAIFLFLIKNYHEYNNFNYIFEDLIPNYYSIFDIKTKKNYKKRKQIKKYKHEIIYIPEPKRLKNVLKIISFYSENFKNYYL